MNILSSGGLLKKWGAGEVGNQDFSTEYQGAKQNMLYVLI